MIDKADMIRALALVGFGSAHWSALWPDSQLELLAPVKAREGCNSVMLSGVLGAGKTSLMACFAQTLFKSLAESANGTPGYMLADLFARRVAYITHDELSDMWSKEFKDDSQSPDGFFTVPILFLDDMGWGADSQTGRNLIRLGGLIDYRWRNNLKTFITSNTSLSDLGKPRYKEWHRIHRRLAEKDWCIYKELNAKYGGKR